MRRQGVKFFRNVLADQKLHALNRLALAQPVPMQVDVGQASGDAMEEAVAKYRLERGIGLHALAILGQPGRAMSSTQAPRARQKLRVSLFEPGHLLQLAVLHDELASRVPVFCQPVGVHQPGIDVRWVVTDGVQQLFTSAHGASIAGAPGGRSQGAARFKTWKGSALACPAHVSCQACCERLRGPIQR